MSSTPETQAEARRAEIVEVLSQLGDTNLLRLYNAVQQVTKGDEAAIRKLADTIEAEAKELEAGLLAGYAPDKFKTLLSEGLGVES